MGDEGAYYFAEKESALIFGFPVKQVVDPIGAGDGLQLASYQVYLMDWK
jgi:2-dehydro-3-deoxygluconokinase